MKKTKVILLFSLLFLLIVIPQSFAVDDEGITEEDNLNSTDYYFDISVSDDGNGTAESPYKNFTDDRIKDNSTIHLAGGEYVFEKSRTFINISFNGLNAYETVLNGNGTTLVLNGNVSFNNIMLTNFKLQNTNSLNAYNVVFKNMISTSDNQANSFGGAIYAKSSKNLYLVNCTFLDNYAEYGGAIYVNSGNLTIINSLFYNNTAYNYGGAIATTSKVKIIINNTRFINDSSLKDAGGAIYIISSTLDAYNVTVVNCSSTFGAGITALRSDLNLTNSTFKDNIAKYNGGAIYQVYGSILLNASEFITNTARNGGAVFLDEVNINNITYNEFKNNLALNYAGAVYTLLVNESRITNNTFENNLADLFNNIYNTSSVNISIGNGNYMMIAINQTYNSSLPSTYDLREYGYVTPVKNQKDGGNCWAFASIAALESCILKATNKTLDLSEENMKNLLALFSDYGIYYRYPNDGGDNWMPIGYLVSWMGPLNESDDEYDDKSHISPVLESLMHVQNVLLLKRNNYTDNDAIKHAIVNYGAVATTMHYNSSYVFFYNVESYGQVPFHYYYDGIKTNHAVTIVGWDDNLTIKNKTGAWLVKNSWGTFWPGNNWGGYFYVSYYDTAFARPGTYNSYTFILNDTQHYDKNYQYDFSGITDYFYNSTSTVWYKNLFNATDNEFVAAVSTYFEKNTDWEINIYVNNTLHLIQNGSCVPGYFTINLDYPVPVAKGDILEVIFKITVEGNAGFPISEPNSLTKCVYNPGVSFVSYDGLNFTELYGLKWNFTTHTYANQVACIKAFTQFITLNSTIKDINITYDSLDLFNITLKLIDENNNTVRNGNVIFTVNDVNHTVEVNDGIAFLQIPFVLGVNNILYVFDSPNYYSSKGNTTFDLSPIKLDVEIDVVQDLNNAVINFIFSQLINENITVKVNDDVYLLNSSDGKLCLNLTGLDYDDYNITVSVNNEVYNCSNSSSFFINFKRTYLTAGNLTTIYNSGDLYFVKLFDQFGETVSNRLIKFVFGNNTFYNKTDENGTCVIAIKLKNSTYYGIISFEGDDLYGKSQNTSVVIVKSSINLPEIKSYVLNSNYEVYFIDKNGSSLNNTLVTFTINNKNYKIKTDSNGKATFAIPVNNGNYPIYVLNPDTGEKISQNIKIVKRITQNRDISVFYGNYITYKVRVCDDLAKFVKDLKVKVTVNGRVYNLKTDKKGYISLKIKLNAGKYTITSEYKGFKVSNKITIKPTLITKNVKVKKGKTLKFTAKLLNSKGKILKNKKISFKFKGKTYKVKTNKKGIATIKIKNLKVGKYNIIASYSKIKNKNIVTVKK